MNERFGGSGGARRPSVSGTEFAGIGVQFALTILVFVVLGVWLDRRLGTTPWLLLICVFLGAGGGFYSIYMRVVAWQRRDAQHREHNSASSHSGRDGERGS